jgi:hypothetical protein
MTESDVTILAKVPPLQKHRREILRAYILKQKKQQTLDGCEHVCVQSAVCEDLRSGTNASPLYDDEIKGRVDGVREQGQQLHDVKTQISILQNKLVSLKEEKHQLFQQLKTVLNEEDEKKKVKDEEQKHSEHVHVDASGDVGDHREGQDNVKRYPAQSPCPSVPSTKQQQQRGPLLPTPEFSRHNLYFWSGCGSDQASTTGGSGAGTRHTLKSSRPPHFSSSTSEQRFGMLPTHHHDAIPAGVAFQQYKATPPYGSVSSPTQSGSVPGTPFSQLGGQVFQIPLHHHRHSCQPLGEPAQMPVPYLSQELPSSSTKQRHHMDQCPRLLNLGLFQARHSVNWEGRFSRYHCTTTDTPVSLSENQHRCLSLTYHREGHMHLVKEEWLTIVTHTRYMIPGSSD